MLHERPVFEQLLLLWLVLSFAKTDKKVTRELVRKRTNQKEIDRERVRERERVVEREKSREFLQSKELQLKALNRTLSEIAKKKEQIKRPLRVRVGVRERQRELNYNDFL